MAWDFDGSSSTSTGLNGLYTSSPLGLADTYKASATAVFIEFEYNSIPSTSTNYAPIFSWEGNSFSAGNFNFIKLALYNNAGSPGILWVMANTWQNTSGNIPNANTIYRVMWKQNNADQHRLIVNGTLGTQYTTDLSGGSFSNSRFKIGAAFNGSTTLGNPNILDGRVYRVCVWGDTGASQIFTDAEAQAITTGDFDPSVLKTDLILFNPDLSADSPWDRSAASNVFASPGSGASFSDAVVPNVAAASKISPISVNFEPAGIIETGALPLWRMMAFNQISELYDPSV
jgi:hypothetical protein